MKTQKVYKSVLEQAIARRDAALVERQTLRELLAQRREELVAASVEVESVPLDIPKLEPLIRALGQVGALELLVARLDEAAVRSSRLVGLAKNAASQLQSEYEKICQYIALLENEKWVVPSTVNRVEDLILEKFKCAAIAGNPAEIEEARGAIERNNLTYRLNPSAFERHIEKLSQEREIRRFAGA